MKEKTQICLLSCSVLKKEIQQLQKTGRLNFEAVFVSKNFHVDYKILEANLRKVLEQTQKRFKGKIVLVYGDLCLGQDGEMKRLADEYGVVKVEAVNCIDCHLGGQEKFLDVDPNHNLMFMGPGMIEFFENMKQNLKGEGMDEAAFAGLFSGIKSIILLDTRGDPEHCIEVLAKSGMNLEVLETRCIGVDGVLAVVLDAIDNALRIK